MPMPVVKASPSTATPSTAATAGFTYVKAIALTGPISAIRAKKTRKASAVQTTLSTTTDAIARPEGAWAGRLNAATGTYASAERLNEIVITPSAGTSERNAATIAGPVA
jgi:hypothetical protein